MSIQDIFISGDLIFFLFVPMARSLQILMDLVPSWAFNAFDYSILFIQRKLRVTQVGLRSNGKVCRIRQHRSSIFQLLHLSI